jgi:hypothetical protein
MLNLNTDRKSWWYTNSIGCSKHIQSEYDQFKYKEKLNQIKQLYAETSSVIKRDVLDDHFFKSIHNNNKFSSNPESLPMYEDVTYDDNNNINEYANKNYTYLENFVRTNCLIPFYYIEIVHSSILIILGIFCIIFGLLLSNAFNEDADEKFDFLGGLDAATTARIVAENPQPLQQLQQQQQIYQQQNQLYQQHPTLLRNNAQIRMEPMYAYNQLSQLQ